MTAGDAFAKQDADPVQARTAAALGDPLAEPVSRVTPGWTAALTLANLGLFMAYFGPLAVLLPNQVQAIAGTHRVVDFSWVAGLGALVAVAVNPLAGALSDRTVSGFGRRGPGYSVARWSPRRRYAWWDACTACRGSSRAGAWPRSA